MAESNAPRPDYDYLFAATAGRSGARRLAAALATCEGVHATHECDPVMDGRIMRWALTDQFPADFLAQRYVMSIRSSREALRCRVRADISKVFNRWYGTHVVRALDPRRCLVVRLRRPPLELIRDLVMDGSIPGEGWGGHWMGDPRWSGWHLRFEPRDEVEAVAWHVMESMVRSEELTKECPGLRVADLDLETIADAESLAHWLRGVGLRPGRELEARLGSVPVGPDVSTRSFECDDSAIAEAWSRVVATAASQGVIGEASAARIAAGHADLGPGRRPHVA